MAQVEIYNYNNRLIKSPEKTTVSPDSFRVLVINGRTLVVFCSPEASGGGTLFLQEGAALIVTRFRDDFDLQGREVKLKPDNPIKFSGEEEIGIPVGSELSAELSAIFMRHTITQVSDQRITVQTLQSTGSRGR